MYPNPQDVLPLAPSPDLQQYRRRAKDLAKACRSGEAGAVRAWASRWVLDLYALQPGAQGGDAGEYLVRLSKHIDAFARERLEPADCALTQAQFVIARAHGFASWTKLVRHLDALSGSGSPTSAFEQAADAIVEGDLTALDRLLANDPGLVRQRSGREHHATLLHYVSANGVENYRQRTPANIVEIARRLLDAGAQVDAEADVYGGGATALLLVVTSAHPRGAGVQNELADLLLARGALMTESIVRDCLANGCPEAAAHMMERGAPVGFTEAAGVGRLDILRDHFDRAGGGMLESALTAALMMAVWYDRLDVIVFLLDRGIDVAARSEDGGHTALHSAAYAGHPRVVELLLRRGAPVNVVDEKYRTTPFVWALHAWLVENREREPYRVVLRMLADAGANVKEQWLDDERLRSDPELFAALRAATGRR